MSSWRGCHPGELFPWATFDTAVPTQEVVTGVRPGARPLRHDEVRRYLQALTDSSPRARLATYSRTHEGRELMVMTISDEQTMTRIDDLREEHAEQVDPRNRPASDDAATFAGAKAVAWMAYGIHGDELSSSDAACALAYWLVAGEDDRAQRLREELVILIDPMENPDGRDRFLAQTRSFAHARPNPDHRGSFPHDGVGRGVVATTTCSISTATGSRWCIRRASDPRSSRRGTRPAAWWTATRWARTIPTCSLRPRAPFNPFLPPTHARMGRGASGPTRLAPSTAAATPITPASGTRSSSRATARPGRAISGPSASCTRCREPRARW